MFHLVILCSCLILILCNLSSELHDDYCMFQLKSASVVQRMASSAFAYFANPGSVDVGLAAAQSALVLLQMAD